MAGSRILYFTTKGKRTTQKVWKSLTSKGLAPEIKIPSRLIKSEKIQYAKLKTEFNFRIVNKNYKPRKKKNKKPIPSIVVESFDVSTPDLFVDDIQSIIHPDYDIDSNIDIEAEEIVTDNFNLLEGLEDVKNFITSP